MYSSTGYDLPMHCMINIAFALIVSKPVTTLYGGLFDQGVVNDRLREQFSSRRRFCMMLTSANDDKLWTKMPNDSKV